MRNLTPEEQAELEQHCIFCKQDLFYEGPQGGIAFNVYCATCLAGYNITHRNLPWQLIAEPGERTIEELLPILRDVARAPTLARGLSEAIEKILRDIADRLHKKDE